MRAFADRLKCARGEISQQKMADLLGIKQSAYGHYETGRSEPSLGKLLKIVEITKISIDWLLGRETVGDRIRKSREAMGMTVQGLASKLGVTEAYVAGVENGANLVDTKSGLIQMFAKELGVTAEYLNDGTPMPAQACISNAKPLQCEECKRKDSMIAELISSVNSLSRQLEQKNIILSTPAADPGGLAKAKETRKARITA